MEEIVARFFDNMFDRLTGPMHLRFFLQPAIALYFGIRDGVKDARAGSQPYLWLVSTVGGQRASLLRESWLAVAKVFFVALAIDLIYQLVVLRLFYLGEAVITAVVLAFVPYILVRGPANRIARTVRYDRKP